MSQYLAERLYLKVHLNASGGKGMPQGMEVDILHTGGFQSALE